LFLCVLVGQFQHGNPTAHSNILRRQVGRVEWCYWSWRLPLWPSSSLLWCCLSWRFITQCSKCGENWTAVCWVICDSTSWNTWKSSFEDWADDALFTENNV